MTDTAMPIQPPPEQDGHLILEPRFTGRSFVAVLRVLVAGESALVSKVDLAHDGARETFVEKVVAELPAVQPGDLQAQLLRLCDDRARWLAQADEQEPQDGRDPTVADLLTQIAFQAAELFHDPDQAAYATLQVGGHFETWPVRSRGFRLWLRRRLREEHDQSAYAEAVQSALEEIESKALFECPEAPVFVRLAEADGETWLDLADDAWRSVRVTATGWTVVEGKPPVRFIRPRGLAPLPAPERGGRIADLRPFLNVRDESDFVLMVAWLLACLRLDIPYPILCLYGEQGSAKSTAAAMLRSLVDPNSAPLRGQPREERDLIISATNSWILGYDNLSHIPPWLSDAFCRLSTGGGFATRELYSDREETIFTAQRPLVLNGIDDVASRSDLLDRALAITLTAIPEASRRDEKALWSDFEAARPRIIGALLDAVVMGIARAHTTRLDRLPRMADFALWVSACEPTCGWPTGTFLRAYTANRSSANETAIEASLVGSAVQAFMAGRPAWQGTSAELLTSLEESTPDNTRHAKAWPTSPRKLSGDLRRVAPNLRTAGVEIDFIRRGRARTIRLSRIPASSDGMGDGSDGTGASVAPDRHSGNSLFDKPLRPAGDGGDGSDGLLPPLSEGRVQLCPPWEATPAQAAPADETDEVAL